MKELSRQGADFLRDVFKAWQTPAFFVQCGSGFEPEALFDATPQTCKLEQLNGMPEGENPDGDIPVFLYGTVFGHPVLAAKGHRHLYEGKGIEPCILPLLAVHCAGCKNIILIESGLSLSKDIKPGTWVLLTDFINAHHRSPLDGLHNILDNPFPDMNSALSQHLNSELVNALAEIGVTPKLGVFYSRPGSQFCTVSEANAARLYGADIIGHDLAMEIIMGQALGCIVSAFALAAVEAPNFYSKPLRRDDVISACRFCSYDLMRGMRKAINDFLNYSA